MNLFVRLPCCFFLAWSLLACSLKNSNLEELRRLCEKDAGVKIYRSVDAKGYYDGSTAQVYLQRLAGSEFDFIEFCDENPDRRTTLEEPGCGRYTRALKDAPNCDPTIQAILDETVGGTYASFREDYCVELELIKEPTARYFYQTGRDVWMGDDGVAKFIRSRVWITDRKMSELMGEYITYILDPSPDAMLWKSCDNIESSYPTFKDADLVNRVLAESKN